MNEKFLPIGTVVILNNSPKKIMITSYLVFPYGKDKAVMYDYGACPYPAGIIDSKYAVGFNHDQIKNVIQLGHTDEEFKELNKALKNMENELRTNLKNLEKN